MPDTTRKPRYVSRRRPVLRVVSADRPRQRAASFKLGRVFLSVEVWTEAEWGALDFYERFADAKHVPGVGWIRVEPVKCDEHDGVEENRVAAFKEREFLHGNTDAYD